MEPATEEWIKKAGHAHTKGGSYVVWEMATGIIILRELNKKKNLLS